MRLLGFILVFTLSSLSLAFSFLTSGLKSISWHDSRSVCQPRFCSKHATRTSNHLRMLDSAARNRERICIVGGGFGGLYTALKLSQLPWGSQGPPQIMLIDKRDKFVFLPLLYELAADTASLGEVAPTYRSLVEGSSISFLQADAVSVDVEGRSISVIGAKCDDLDGAVVRDAPDQSRDVAFDRLVLALGAVAATTLVPGVEENSIPFYTVEDSYRLQKELRRLKARGSTSTLPKVVVAGGSVCGIEVATTVASTLGKDRCRVTVIAKGDEVLAGAAVGNQQAGKDRLRKLGVDVMTKTIVTEVKPGSVMVQTSSSGGDSETFEIDSDLTIWTVGSKPAALSSASPPLSVDKKGKIIVDNLMAAEGGQGAVYCLGDMAAVQGQTYKATAQVAMQQAEVVAWNLWAPTSGRPPLPFKYSDLGEMLTLGGVDGALSTLNALISLRGPIAAVARRAVYTLRMPTPGQRVNAATSAAIGLGLKVTGCVFDKGLGAVEKGIGWIDRALGE